MVYIFEHGHVMAYVCVTDKKYDKDPEMFGTPITLKLSDADWDEAYHALRYTDHLVVGYLPDEKAWVDAERAAKEAHEYLESTDYISCKIADGAATREEYADVLERRGQMRKVINDFEAMPKPKGLNTPLLKISSISDRDLNTNPFHFPVTKEVR